ncbi:MAG: 30S ribosomal protein S3 [Candidatus Nanoarchaeia archaeon]
MIEREFIKEKKKHLKIKEYLMSVLPKAAGLGRITIEKTPFGEHIILEAVKPGMIIGRGGQTITAETNVLKTKFNLENPQIEIKEVPVPELNAAIMANRICSELERFGTSRFKAIGYKALQSIMNAGALGAEIRIGGRGVPGQRAKNWRFAMGHMMKAGQIALEEIDTYKTAANLHSGTVGVKVSIMLPNTKLPDKIKLKETNKEMQKDSQKNSAKENSKNSIDKEVKEKNQKNGNSKN